jgi:hypothetical protein
LIGLYSSTSFSAIVRRGSCIQYTWRSLQNLTILTLFNKSRFLFLANRNFFPEISSFEFLDFNNLLFQNFKFKMTKLFLNVKEN